ncbi:MAG: ABC transporter ATP-binding protein [Ktedonobacteraceae bacterium]|nr:ABC transporter ATP-binding protein [Ktedonobacteraceae bacterium]
MFSSVKRYFALLVTYLKPQWYRTVLLAILLLSSIGLQLLNPQILKNFIDTALAQGTSSSLIYDALLFTGIALLDQITSVSASYLSTNIAWTATNQLRSDLVAHCLSLDMGFHKERTPGEMIERIDGDVDDLSNFFSEFVVSLLTNVLLLLGILILFFTISWLVCVVMSAFSLIVLLILMRMRRRITPLWTAERQMSALFYGFLSERLGGTEDIRANGATAYIMRRFYMLVREWYPVRRRAVVNGNFMFIVAIFTFTLGSVLALALGLYLWSIGTITVGTVYLLFSYTDKLSQPLQQIQSQLQDLQQAEACMIRTEALLGITTALPDGQEHFPPLSADQEQTGIEFERVTFGYVADEPVIHDLSFLVEPGKVLGIIGRTGSGKTTLARLLFRLYDPQQGKICINGVPIQNIQLRELRRRIGMVTQDVQLFSASVRDNLAFFNRSISDEHILRAINEVGLSAWYCSLPAGLDTVLGTDGEGLSAGEAQLLAFTRVLLNDPAVVILDEASSRLDPATEHIIEQAIEKLFAGRTAIVIAHHLATIQRADNILIIEDGHILEQGERETLANDADSHFSFLLRTGLEEVLA